jgi:hypothetical protein
MKVAMMQPTFLPWLGYFELIEKADLFIFLDDFQFSRQSWHQRNRIFTGKDQVGWLTVPVVHNQGQALNETKIDYSGNWQKKAIETIRQNYKADDHAILHLLNCGYNSLAYMNMALILDMITRMIMCVNTQVRLSSNIAKRGKGSEIVASILRHVGATTYYCAAGAFKYMRDEGIFPVKDIEVLFQDHQPIPYSQARSSMFVPRLSAIDALFNVGAERTRELIRGTQHWKTWEEMTCK